MTLYRTGANADKADVESLVRLGVLVPVEPLLTIGPISPKSYLKQQLGLQVGKTYAVVEIGEETP